MVVLSCTWTDQPKGKRSPSPGVLVKCSEGGLNEGAQALDIYTEVGMEDGWLQKRMVNR